MDKNQNTKEHITSIGGSAVMEGVMMKGPKEIATAVRKSDGEIVLDFVGKQSGRVAYICPSESCFKKARKSNRISNMLECAIPEEIYDEMQKRIAEEA